MSEGFVKPPGFGVGDTEEQKALRKEAAEIGLKFRGRPKAEKMRKMLEQRKAELADPALAQARLEQEAAEKAAKATPAPEAVPTPQKPVEPVTAPPAKPQGKLYLTEEEFRKSHIKDSKREAGRLVRVRITCMNPNKKNWTGEIVSVGSSKIGTFKKFIPFGLEEPYHIPMIIYNHLKEKKCAIRTVRKTPDGKEHIDTKMINEFAIDVLPPLTPKELDDLKHQQAMARGAA